MPLPEATERKHIHTRAIEYTGYEREDGLFDIEAQMTDTKTYQFKNNWRGDVKIGEPLHKMLLRITIDDNFTIRDVVAATEASPFEMCPSITPVYAKLIGIQMGRGWRKQIRQSVGGVQGCTHLTELLFPMATVAMQTIWPLQSLRRKQAGSEVEKSDRRPGVLNTCHAWSSDSPVVEENAPKFYTGD